ncbi:MAG: ABC transporter substrate-binding protein [Candidatus Limnocylindrales bacterium]
MTNTRRLFAVLALLALAASACGPAPAETPLAPASGAASSQASSTAAPSDVPFAPVAWPASGSACGSGGSSVAGSRLGRVQAVDARTVVFTLCVSDGAFLARLAHPSMGIVDAADLARIAADPSAIRDVSGHGSYRVAQWGNDNVELARVGAATSSAAAPTLILRWAADPAARTADLVKANVDGIDAPTPDGLDSAATMPSLAVVGRPLLATTVLGFGKGAAFADVRVRRAIASGIDTGALAQAFPAGATAADHLVPCDVPAGCAGSAFRAFNGPASVAALQGVKFNFGASYPLTIPDAPIPGLPDPAGVAAALQDQMAANLGLAVQVQTMPADQFRAAVDGGTIAGLFLDGVAAGLADPSAFYNPLFLDHPKSLAAQRASSAVRGLLTAATTPGTAARQAAYAAAATKLRDSVPVAPLVHPGAETIFRADVVNAATSPLGEDPLGVMTAGDRGQVVFEQAAAPAGGWCGALPSADAYRLCGLVTDGLYGYAAGSLEPTPRLATACTANADATVWTCRLRQTRTGSGLLLDAADVVATIRAMADPTDPVHQALGDAAFTAWTDLFGLVPGSLLHPAPAPTPTPSATPAASASASATPASGSPVPGATPGPSKSAVSSQAP